MILLTIAKFKCILLLTLNNLQSCTLWSESESPIDHDLTYEETLPQGSLPPRVPPYMEELIALCLATKLWGEIMPIAFIIAVTKADWRHIKGAVEYIDLGNGWVMLRSTTASDKEYVWFNIPWFVKGLAFVLNV